MNTLVTRLVVTMIVSTCVFAPAPVRGQEQVTQKPRVDFRFNADQPTSLRAPLLTAARPAAVRAPPVPRRKMPTGVRIAIGAAIGFGAGFMYLMRAPACDNPYLFGPPNPHDLSQCTLPFVGMIAGGGVIGYFAGR